MLRMQLNQINHSGLNRFSQFEMTRTLKMTRKFNSSFQADPTSDGRFGTLKVTYTKGYTKLINGQILPWRRAFSQVDCQHRLGKMHNSSMPVTFCIFVDMNRHQEALVFRDINRNQKGIPTALVDTIIYSTDDNPPAHIAWAWNLGIDSGSSLYRLVDTGGRGQGETLINSRGLSTKPETTYSTQVY